MRSFLLAVALALASSAVPLIADAAPAVPDSGHAYVYLGHVADNGRLDAPKFSGVPVLTVSNERVTDLRFEKPRVIVAIEGMRLRGAPSPTSDALGQLPIGGRVKLLSVHAAYGFVWGEVDTAGAKVLGALMRQSGYACDGFTGRSGFGPTSLVVQPIVMASARSGSVAPVVTRLRC